MTVEEFRIGNYVEYADVQCKVIGYCKEGWLETNGVCAPIKAYQSIKLDEKQLKLLGFEYVEKFNVWAYNGFQLEPLGDMLLEKRYGVLIQSVHKLQNFYYLTTGKELEYKK